VLFGANLAALRDLAYKNGSMNRNASLTLFFFVTLSACCAAQTHDDIQLGGSFDGNTYKNAHIGLTYSYPDKLQPQSLATLPPPSDGRTHILLALWNSPKQTPTPRIVMFIDDVSSYPNVTTARYLLSMTKAAQQGGADISKEPVEVVISGLKFLRLDYRRPKDPAQLYNSGFVALWNKYALVFQINSATPGELEDYAKSVKSLSVSRKQANR
jgi:hypothetical protein